MKRLIAAVLLVVSLTACGGAEYNTNTNPRRGWVSIDADLEYRCIGHDKVLRETWDGNITTVKNSEDCQ